MIYEFLQYILSYDDGGHTLTVTLDSNIAKLNFVLDHIPVFEIPKATTLHLSFVISQRVFRHQFVHIRCSYSCFTRILVHDLFRIKDMRYADIRILF